MSVQTQRVRRLVGVLALSVSLLLVWFNIALAHEHREVGPYSFTIGWRVEPALVEQPNGLDLRVTTHAEADHQGEGEEDHHEEGAADHHAAEVPVTGLEGSLKAEVIFGGKSMPLTLRPRFNEPGAYTADLIPTRAGSYIFHITGEISGTQIDERFDSADGEFSDVETSTALQFPEPVSVGGELQSQLAAAQSAASTAQLLGGAGLVVGLLGLAVGGMAFRRRA